MNQNNPEVISVYIDRDEEDRRGDEAHDILVESLGKRGIWLANRPQEAQAMVVLGGDGAFLHAAQRHDFPDVPMTGISTGTLGYYMSTLPNAESIDYMTRNLSEGDYRLMELPLLELRSLGGSLLRLAANDIVVKSSGFQAFKAGLKISGTNFDHFVGSGIVFSTPQGSSGEGVANGGPFISEGLPVWSITPEAKHMSNAYHSLIEPLILGKDDEVEVEIKEAFKRPFAVGVDGQDVDWTDQGNGFAVGLSKEKSIKRIRLNNNTYLQDIARIFRGSL